MSGQYDAAGRVMSSRDIPLPVAGKTLVPTRGMTRSLIRRKPKPSTLPCETYTAAVELLTSVIDFMGYTESVIKPMLLAPGKYFNVAIGIARGGPIEL